VEFKEEFLERLKNARSVVFFTGAGISAESGIPTFRGNEGLWKKFRPEELANFDAFIRNPDLVWEWYQYRRKIVEEAKPNKGHLAIAEMENYFEDVSVITQNVDNLHSRAGSTKIFELHGNIERNYCIDCKTFYTHEELNEAGGVPKCKLCGGLIRPDVVWFGEPLPQNVFSSAERAARKSDVCFVVGTSAVVYPAAYIPDSAKSGGSYVVEVNIEPTDLSYRVDYSITGKAGEILPAVLEEVKKLKTKESK